MGGYAKTLRSFRYLQMPRHSHIRFKFRRRAVAVFHPEMKDHGVAGATHLVAIRRGFRRKDVD